MTLVWASRSAVASWPMGCTLDGGPAQRRRNPSARMGAASSPHADHSRTSAAEAPRRLHRDAAPGRQHRHPARGPLDPRRRRGARARRGRVDGDPVQRPAVRAGRRRPPAARSGVADRPPASSRTWLRKAVLRGSRSAVLRASLLQAKVQGIARQALSRGYWIARAMGAPGSAGGGIRYRPGDWVVLLDSNWGPDLRPELARAKLAGARICVVIYDLIQIDHPELVSPGAGAIYRRWFERVVPMADRILAISDTVSEEVRRYLQAHPEPFLARAGELVPPGRRFRALRRDEPVSAKCARFAKGRAANVSRRGHARAQEGAGHRARRVRVAMARGPRVPIDLHRSRGMGSHALAARLRTHAELGHRLHWLHPPPTRTSRCATKARRHW